ncbi:MAG TPA: class I SAM-dependent methyltransferase [Gemmatimonadaceae bacterium]
MDVRQHWETIYATKAATELSWFQRCPSASLELVQLAAPGHDARIIDVGGGASTLADHLLDAGYEHVTVLDVSAGALDQARRRLDTRAASVRWIESDVLTAELPSRAFDVWHDRAVFHFLTDASDRRRYVAQLAGALAPTGHAVIGTFAEDGPTRCSGLEVRRYSPAELAAELGSSFELVESRRESHHTPSGAEQRFAFSIFRRT